MVAVRLTPEESEAVEIVVRLVAIERALRALASVESPDTDAR